MAEETETEKEKREKRRLRIDVFFYFTMLFFFIMFVLSMNATTNNIGALSDTTDTLALSNQLTIKLLGELLENDQVIAEELLDQRERIEIIEAQLGITEAGSYDSFGE